MNQGRSGDPSKGVWRKDKVIFHAKSCLGDFLFDKDWIHFINRPKVLSMLVTYHLLHMSSWYNIVTRIRAVIWNAPKSMWKMYFHVRPYARKIWNAPKSNTPSFSIFLFEISSRGFYKFEKFEMPHLRVIVFENGAFQIFRAYKNHVIRFRIEK